MNDSNEARQAILNVISLIPKGQVSTYGDIARMAGHSGKARFVGFILKKLPPDSTIPWHRVINSQGYISFPENSDKFTLQRDLLLIEGIQFTGARTSLKTYGWKG